MISKRSLGSDLIDVVPRERLRYNITDLFLSNTVSGASATSLLSDANAAGAARLSDLSNLGGRVLETQSVAQTLLLHVPSPERAPRNGRHRSLPNTFVTRSAVRFPRARCERQQITGHGPC